VDGSGQVYVTGRADSGDFPTLHAIQPVGSFDAFVTKLTATGALAYSTYLAEIIHDEPNKIVRGTTGVDPSL
jgi:hypothetical protein